MIFVYMHNSEPKSHNSGVLDHRDYKKKKSVVSGFFKEVTRYILMKKLNYI